MWIRGRCCRHIRKVGALRGIVARTARPHDQIVDEAQQLPDGWAGVVGRVSAAGLRVAKKLD